MKIALLCIGDELLKGATVNTNLAYIGNEMLTCGLVPDYAMEIPDQAESISSALTDALEKADIIITSGGLGPTADDVTKEVIARTLSLPLEQDGQTVLAIRRYWKIRHTGEPSGRILNQSLVPKGAEVIPNQNGTAPGLVIRKNGKTVILLPGPPGELCPMFTERILPILKQETKPVCRTKLYHICGIGESEIEERMLPYLTHTLTAAYCATHQCVKLFLNSLTGDQEQLDQLCRTVKAEFGNAVLNGSSAAEDVVQLLRTKGMTLSTAESCTGGLTAKMITDVAGASEVYPGSIVSYANPVKEQFLGVKHETLTAFGAVSRETALEMVKGISARMGTDCAISLTGIAGPGGGSPEKPVGLVFCGVKCRERCEVFEFRLTKSREQIRERAAASALNKLRLMLLET